MTEEEKKAFIKDRLDIMKTMFYWWLAFMIPFVICEYMLGYFD